MSYTAVFDPLPDTVAVPRALLEAFQTHLLADSDALRATMQRRPDVAPHLRRELTEIMVLQSRVADALGEDIPF